MKREAKEYRQPYGRGDYALHRGDRGVYWQAESGLVVRLAANERQREAHPPGRAGEVLPSEVGPGPARS